VGVDGVSLEWIRTITPMITLGEVGQQISQLIRNIIVTALDVFTPIINALGISMILVGLLLALGLRQEWLGYRLIVGGLLMLAFVHFIAPMLLQFL
jgi:hypothetical protein